MQIPSLDNMAKLSWTLMSNPSTREFRASRKPIRLRQQHHNSSGKRVTVTIPSNPGAFGFYENKSAAVSVASQMRSKQYFAQASTKRVSSYFFKGPRACVNACLKYRFMYTKEIRLVEMLRVTFDLQKNTLFRVCSSRDEYIYPCYTARWIFLTVTILDNLPLPYAVTIIIFPTRSENNKPEHTSRRQLRDMPRRPLPFLRYERKEIIRCTIKSKWETRCRKIKFAKYLEGCGSDEEKNLWNNGRVFLLRIYIIISRGIIVRIYS